MVGIASIYGKIFKLHDWVLLLLVSNLHFNAEELDNDFELISFIVKFLVGFFLMNSFM